MGKTKENKSAYFEKLSQLMETYPSIMIVNVDNVGSNQMHQIRQALRGKGQILMGKNTMVRRAVRDVLAEKPQYERFLPHVRGNVGFVFTDGDLKEIREIILSNKVAAPARAGAFAPATVTIPAGPTGMEPGKTSFFQALGIPTKIARGAIEIVSAVDILVAGSRVGPSEATLLNMLNISPFTYGLKVVQIYDQGQAFAPSVLDIEESQLLKSFAQGIATIASISLVTGYATLPSIMHSFMNSTKNVIALSLATDYTFFATEELKDRLANPDAYASSAPAAAEAAAPAAKEEEKAAEPEEDSDEDMGLGLFD